MFIILNRANLVVSVTSAVCYASAAPGGLPISTTPEEAEAVYSSASDAFYPLNSAVWNGGGYHVEEVEAVPDVVVPGFYYYNEEFYTTPEKEAELYALEAQRTAPAAASIAFVTLAETGQIDDATASENSAQFAPWAYPIDYKAGAIRRDPLDGNLYRVNEGQGHTSQEGWNPSLTPALWKKIGDPAEEWPAWAPPLGAHDAYGLGDKVTHNGVKWVSTAAANVWEPGVYGWEAAEA